MQSIWDVHFPGDCLVICLQEDEGHGHNGSGSRAIKNVNHIHIFGADGDRKKPFDNAHIMKAVKALALTQIDKSQREARR
jgi:hypothetical protein